MGLLNRLDNETSGLLYFAKTPRVFHQFKTLQASSQLYKYYVAEVYGDMSFLVASSQQGVMGEAIYTVRFPMVHHKYAVERMVAIRSPRDLLKAKGFPRSVMTEILEVQVLKDKGTSIVLVRIHKGFRHQIRVHLATLGYPICGDYLYAKSKHTQYDKLQLFSIGLETLV
ncbi:MAG: RNA pseudouridine synthase [Candidatus Peribacteria bacterium]|nr:RNA pseudouridine synthase [Candidatus Peribacteria bacterium]